MSHPIPMHLLGSAHTLTLAQAVKALSEKLQLTKAKVAPKSRFAFKTKVKSNPAIPITDAAELAYKQRLDLVSDISSTKPSLATTPTRLQTPPEERAGVTKDTPINLSTSDKNYDTDLGTSSATNAVPKQSLSRVTDISLSGLMDQHVVLASPASHSMSSGSLTNLKRCIVDMSVPTTEGAPFAGLALKNIKHSLIVAGHVAGAAHITAVEDSVIVVASRQVRMHECKNVDIYLLCASRPIIEDCSNVRFSPMPECYVCHNPQCNLRGRC